MDEILKLSVIYAFQRLRFNISIRKLFSFVRHFGRHVLKFQILVSFGGMTDVKVLACSIDLHFKLLSLSF